MADPKPRPFVDDLLKAKRGTLYLLSDAQARIRDAHAVLTLTRFFARNGVDLAVRPMLAEHSPTFDTRELQLVFQQGADIEQAERLLAERRTVDERIQRLFKLADEIRRRQIAETHASEPIAYLAARGPVLLLGRPKLFPKALLNAIDAELGDAGPTEGVVGRFEFLCDDPFEDPDAYRRIRDTYSGRCFPPPVFPHANGLDDDLLREYRDYAILRIVRARYRSFVFAYGSGSLGTLAAAQTLIDKELNAMLLSIGIDDYLRTHHYVELLLQAEQHSMPRRPWKSEFSPSNIRIGVRPVPPVPPDASAFLQWLPSDREMFSIAGDPSPLYARRPDNPGSFDCLQIHPRQKDHSTGSPFRLGNWTLVGGAKVASVIEEIRKLADAPRPTALLLVGETGVGKEIAARVLFEAVTTRLLRSLAQEAETAYRSVVLGPHFVAVNCAALTETLSASELFGVGADVGTGVAARRGPFLEAGEGVVMLDEIESMRTSEQASLLRVLDPPHRVTPVGKTAAIPVNAVVVACTNVEPTVLVADDRLRSDLFARLRVHTIVIPPLRERREDIPALLAFLAGGAIRIALSALTALVLHDHPLNVRGLLAVVERARRRHSLATGSQATGGEAPIHIAKDDLDDDLIDIADDLFRETLSGSAEQDVMEFHVEHPDPRLGYVFEQAAEILASYRLTTTKAGLRINDRPRETRFDFLWESTEKGKSEANMPRKREPEERFVEQWLDLVSDLERTLDPQPEILQQALAMTAKLFLMRWSKKRDQTYVKGLLGRKNKERRGRKHAPSVQTQHLAASLGSHSSAIDNLMAKGEA